ncbi:MAG: hypothetical protein ACKOW9_06110 [Candidatus Paceibacterota bacterium]
MSVPQEYGVDQLIELLSPSRNKKTVTGVITEASSDVAIVKLLDGRTTSLPITEFYPNKKFVIGSKFIFITDEDDELNRPKISTNSDELIELLFASVVPELRTGQVRVVRVARSPGIRSKIAVAATEEGIDAVGCFIGKAANRVSMVSKLLSGERLDIVAYHPEIDVFIRNTIGVRVNSIDSTDGLTNLRVPAHQYQAAVGGGGMNAILTAKLIGKRISILPDEDVDLLSSTGNNTIV